MRTKFQCPLGVLPTLQFVRCKWPTPASVRAPVAPNDETPPHGWWLTQLSKKILTLTEEPRLIHWRKNNLKKRSQNTVAPISGASLRVERCCVFRKHVTVGRWALRSWAHVVGTASGRWRPKGQGSRRSPGARGAVERRRTKNDQDSEREQTNSS